jgi:hypothetical protein
VTKRSVVVSDDSGSRVRTVADASIQPGVVADQLSTRAIAVDVGILEKVSLVINLDDQGLIESVNSESRPRMVESVWGSWPSMR